MGKIRVKTLGIEEAEKKQKQEALKRQEKKSAIQRTAKVPGLKGGQRIVAVGPSEEELAKALEPSQKPSDETPKAETPKTAKVKSKGQKKRGKKYQISAKLIDKNKVYPLQEALDLLPKIHLTSFDETVELHINTAQGTNVTATLPYGSGKKIRVAIADDEVIDNVAHGKIDFDVLLAEPNIMPKLARIAKFLGPRGLMPNPKNGTITKNPQELVQKFEKGQTSFKTEAKAPIMHVSVGKLSFGEQKLMDNIKTVLAAVKPQNIKNATLKSTMSAGIKIQFD